MAILRDTHFFRNFHFPNFLQSLYAGCAEFDMNRTAINHDFLFLNIWPESMICTILCMGNTMPPRNSFSTIVTFKSHK